MTNQEDTGVMCPNCAGLPDEGGHAVDCPQGAPAGEPEETAADSIEADIDRAWIEMYLSIPPARSGSRRHYVGFGDGYRAAVRDSVVRARLSEPRPSTPAPPEEVCACGHRKSEHDLPSVFPAPCVACAFLDRSCDGLRPSQPVEESAPLRDDTAEVCDHDFLPVNGHPDDDECTYRSDGTDDTYCGLPLSAHVTEDEIQESARRVAFRVGVEWGRANPNPPREEETAGEWRRRGDEGDYALWMDEDRQALVPLAVEAAIRAEVEHSLLVSQESGRMLADTAVSIDAALEAAEREAAALREALEAADRMADTAEVYNCPALHRRPFDECPTPICQEARAYKTARAAVLNPPPVEPQPSREAELVTAARQLRAAQREYMEHRGDDSYGATVAECAVYLDAALAEYDRDLAARPIPAPPASTHEGGEAS